VTMVVDITDVVTHTNFGDHRLRGFGGAGSQISPFPIDFHRRSYNTLALPCERVISPVRASVKEGTNEGCVTDHVRQFVRDDRRNSLLVLGRRLVVVVEEVRLAVRHQSPVLHRARAELRHRDLICTASRQVNSALHPSGVA